jgi:hypothetical protein
MEKYHVIPLFSKTIYITNVELNEDEESKLNNIYYKSEFTTARDCDQDNDSCDLSKNLQILNNNNLLFLKEKIMNSFHHFSKDVLKYKNDFIITNSWFTKTQKGQSSVPHSHSNHMFSMVYYWGNEDTDDNKIEFKNYNTSSFYIHPKEQNIYNSNDWIFKINNSMLVIFPAEVPHLITKNKNNNIRKSLAMNLLPKGYIGSADGEVQLIKS